MDLTPEQEAIRDAHHAMSQTERRALQIAKSATRDGHEPGSCCPACPTYDKWAANHCYECGGVYHEEVIDHDDSERLSSVEHADAFHMYCFI